MAGHAHGGERAKAGQARAGGQTGRRGPAVRPSGVGPAGACWVAAAQAPKLAALMRRCQHPHDRRQSPTPRQCTQHLHQPGTPRRPCSWPVASLIHQACSARLSSHQCCCPQPNAQEVSTWLGVAPACGMLTPTLLEYGCLPMSEHPRCPREARPTRPLAALREQASAPCPRQSNPMTGGD